MDGEPQHPFEVQLLTLFPEFFGAALGASVLGRALERDLWRYTLIDLRDFATDRHRTCDDTPYGGGAGMVMKVDVVVAALEDAERRRTERGLSPPLRIALTPAGVPMSQAIARELAAQEAITLLCGRYEGFDERVMAHVDRELSLGDFVMTGGEPAALAIIDAVVRLRPGVLGNASSAQEESFAHDLLEYPQYTRPAEFRGQGVPEILTSGDHGKIARWRHAMALLRTLERRPDLLAGVELDQERRKLLDEARQWRQQHSRDAREGAAREGE